MEERGEYDVTTGEDDETKEVDGRGRMNGSERTIGALEEGIADDGTGELEETADSEEDKAVIGGGDVKTEEAVEEGVVSGDVMFVGKHGDGCMHEDDEKAWMGVGIHDKQSSLVGEDDEEEEAE